MNYVDAHLKMHGLILLTVFTIVSACDDETSPPQLTPRDQGVGRDFGMIVPDALDARIESDLGRRSAFGEPCEEGRDCESGLCIDTPQGRVCTDRCIGDCPPGFECIPTSLGGDDTLLCVVDRDEICERCVRDEDCDDPEDLCLLIGNLTYCGEACDDDTDCPEGFACALIEREAISDGEISLSEIPGDAGVTQCVPVTEECAPCLDDDGDGYGVGDD